MERIPESTFLKISDFLSHFKINSKRFVVAILTQNFAFNISGAFFFLGLSYSLKWWYKDQLLLVLLKQNLPAFSEPQQKISWETGKFIIEEQTCEFVDKEKKVLFEISDFTNNASVSSSFIRSSTPFVDPLGMCCTINNGSNINRGEKLMLFVPFSCVKQGMQRKVATKNTWNQNLVTNLHSLRLNNQLMQEQPLTSQRMDIYSNSVIVNFKTPWQKHAYHRFVGIFPELARPGTLGLVKFYPKWESGTTNDCNDKQMHPHWLRSTENAQQLISTSMGVDTPNESDKNLKAEAFSSKSVKPQVGLKSKISPQISPNKKYIFLQFPKNVFKLSARGLCFLNEKANLEPTIWTFFSEIFDFKQKSVVHTLKVPLDIICESPKKQIDAHNAPSPKLVKKGAKNNDGFTVLDVGLGKLGAIVGSQFFVDDTKLSKETFGKNLLTESNINLTTTKNSISDEKKEHKVLPINFVRPLLGTKKMLQKIKGNQEKFSYPLNLTKNMSGWQPPIEILILSCYLDEIPYKLESTLSSFFGTKNLSATWSKTVGAKSMASETNLIEKSLQKTESPYRLNALFEIKQLLKNELQFLINSFPLIFVNQNQEMPFPLGCTTKKEDRVDCASVQPDIQQLSTDVIREHTKTQAWGESQKNFVNLKTHPENATLYNNFFSKSGLIDLPGEKAIELNEIKDFKTSHEIQDHFKDNSYIWSDKGDQRKNLIDSTIKNGSNLTNYLKSVQPVQPVQPEVVKVALISQEDNVLSSELSFTPFSHQHEYSDSIDLVNKNRSRKKAETSFNYVEKHSSDLYNKNSNTIKDFNQKILQNSVDPLVLLNKLGITFNNLSFLKCPPVLLPTHQNASCWVWNKHKLKNLKIQNKKIATSQIFYFDSKTLTWQILQQLNSTLQPLIAPLSPFLLGRERNKSLLVKTQPVVQSNFENDLSMSDALRSTTVPPVQSVQATLLASRPEGKDQVAMIVNKGHKRVDGEIIAISDCTDLKPKSSFYKTPASNSYTYPINKIVLKQNQSTLEEIDNINPVDNLIKLTPKKVKFMSGYIYPDMQNNCLRSNLYRWIQFKSSNFSILPPVTHSAQKFAFAYYTTQGHKENWCNLCNEKNDRCFDLCFHLRPKQWLQKKAILSNSTLVTPENVVIKNAQNHELYYQPLISRKIFKKTNRFLDNGCLIGVQIPISSTHAVNLQQWQHKIFGVSKTLTFPIDQVNMAPFSLCDSIKGNNKDDKPLKNNFIQSSDTLTYYKSSSFIDRSNVKTAQAKNKKAAFPLLQNKATAMFKGYEHAEVIGEDFGATKETTYSPCTPFPVEGERSKKNISGQSTSNGWLHANASVQPKVFDRRSQGASDEIKDFKEKNLLKKSLEIQKKSADTKTAPNSTPFLTFCLKSKISPKNEWLKRYSPKGVHWKFDHHLAHFPGFPKPNQFTLSLTQLAQGNDFSETVFPTFYNALLERSLRPERGEIIAISDCTDFKQKVNTKSTGSTNHLENATKKHNVVQSVQPEVAMVVKDKIDCSPRRTAYRGIVAQRDDFTKDFQSPKTALKIRSMWGTIIFGPDNPLTDRQSHFFGQRRLSTLDLAHFQRDYLRQLGKDTLLQSNSKGHAEYATSVDRVKILSFSKSINSFLFKKRKYAYLLKDKDQWHLLFQEQLRSALEDSKKYPPLTPEQVKEYGPNRIKVSAPLILARFPKKQHSYKVLAHEKKENKKLETNFIDAIRTNGTIGTTPIFNQYSGYKQPRKFSLPPSSFEYQEKKSGNSLYHRDLCCPTYDVLSETISHYPQFTETYNSPFNSTLGVNKNSLPCFHKLQYFTQERLNANSWLIVSQWSFLIALLIWVEQTFLGDILPALSTLEQLLLGATGIKSGDRTHVLRISKGDTPKFKDIAGIDGLLGELAELVLFLRGHKERLWNKKSSYGVLLTGPPGTGKTFLVRALANEAKVPVLILSAGTLTANKANNNKPSWSIRHAFRRAKQLAPCILFIDEIDAFGRSRGKIATDINEIVADTKLSPNQPTHQVAKREVKSLQPGREIEDLKEGFVGSKSVQSVVKSSISNQPKVAKSAMISQISPQISNEINSLNEIYSLSLYEDEAFSLEPTSKRTLENTNSAGVSKKEMKRKFGPLTQLLVSMDGVKSLSGVLIMGATNRFELLDPALTRPGRFERIIRVEKPAEQKRIEILQLYSRNLGFESTTHKQRIPWSYLANRTVGLTAADLAVAMNYSSLKAILQGTTHTIETIEYGLDSIARFSHTSFIKNKRSKLVPYFFDTRSLANFKKQRLTQSIEIQKIYQNQFFIDVIHSTSYKHET